MSIRPNIFRFEIISRKFIIHDTNQLRYAPFWLTSNNLYSSESNLIFGRFGSFLPKLEGKGQKVVVSSAQIVFSPYCAGKKLANVLNRRKNSSPTYHRGKKVMSTLRPTQKKLHISNERRTFKRENKSVKILFDLLKKFVSECFRKIQ